MAQYRFPDNPRFRKLAAKLADKVTVEINRGVQVSVAKFGVSDSCRCPLGCIPGNPRFPSPSIAASTWGSSFDEAAVFMDVLDSAKPKRFPFQYSKSLRPFFELGRAYRERFVGG